MDIQATLDEIINEVLPLSDAGYGTFRPEVTRARIQVQLVEKLTPLFKEVVRPVDFVAPTTALNGLISDLMSMRLSSSDETKHMPYDEAKDIAWNLLRGYDRDARRITSISWQAKGRMVVTYRTAGLSGKGTGDKLTYVHNQGDPK